MTRRVPGPITRLLRQPLRVGAIALLAVTALAASGIHSAAALALRDTVDENWRGAYDILVTAPDGMAPIDGLLPPNTLASGAGLTLDDLASVRAVADVEIAAPIGEILVPALKFGNPQVIIPLGAVEGVDAGPQAFRLTATYTTDDGLGERIVTQRVYPLVVDEKIGAVPSDEWERCRTGQATTQGSNGDHEIDPEKYPALMAAMCAWMKRDQPRAVIQTTPSTSAGTEVIPGDDFMSLSLPSAPQTITRLTLVDPEAERALLGDAGAFLDPLVAAGASVDTDVEAMKAWAASQSAEATAQFDDLMAYRAGVGGDHYPPEAMAELRALYRDNGDDFDEFIAGLVADERYVPLLVAENPIAQLSLKVDVEGFGTVGASEDPVFPYDVSAALLEGESGEPVGSVVGDISELLNPFTLTTRPLTWPGVDLAYADRSLAPAVGNILSVGRLDALPYDAGTDTMALTAAGFITYVHDLSGNNDPLKLGSDGSTVGAESAYTSARKIWEATSGAPPLAISIGTFDAAVIGVDEAAADYVPLGAYGPVSSTLTEGAHAGTTMLPSMAGLGLVSPRTVAIASIHSAGLWQDNSPISAIRVRVAGIDAYTPEAQNRVIAVAQAIEQLGLSASIVAGSSPTDADVHVRDYAFGTTDPAGSQTVGDLGVVTQRWSELGAAARVSLSVSSTTLVVLGIALAAGILLLGAVQLAGIPGRREQAVVMREIGFTRSRIARWFAGEELPGLVAVTAVGAVAWWLSGGTGIAALAAGAAVIAVLAASVVSVVAGSQAARSRMPKDARSRRLGARSVAAFGARQALVHPLTTAIHVLAIVIVGLSAAALAVALLTGRETAGASSLALLAFGRQLLPQLALGGTGVIGGILLAQLTRRLDLARRADQWATLRASGWTTRQLGTAQRAEGMAIALPALVLTAALAVAGALWLEFEPLWVPVAVAVAAGLVTALVAFIPRRKAAV